MLVQFVVEPQLKAPPSFRYLLQISLQISSNLIWSDVEYQKYNSSVLYVIFTMTSFNHDQVYWIRKIFNRYSKKKNLVF